MGTFSNNIVAKQNLIVENPRQRSHVSSDQNPDDLRCIWGIVMLGSTGIIRSPRTKDPYEPISIMECHVRVLNIAHVELMAGSFYQKISQKIIGLPRSGVQGILLGEVVHLLAVPIWASQS